VLVALAAGVVGSSAGQAFAASVPVSVGYADSLRASPNLPTPWLGSPNVNFIGDPGAWDAGAVRLDNPTSSPISIDSVVVDLARPGPTFNLWGAFSIPANGSAILTETANFNFDTSDFAISGCGVFATTNAPTVTVTIGGIPSTLTDTGHVLDTGGFDAVCLGNESLQWRAIGGIGAGTIGGSCAFSPPTRVVKIGKTAVAEARVLDAAGSPLANVEVDFTVTAGPNAGTTGKAFTNTRGVAKFVYVSPVGGTDTVQGSVPNLSGGAFSCSNNETVTWQ